MRHVRSFLVLGLLVVLAAPVVHAQDQTAKKDATKANDVSAVLEARERQMAEAFKNKDVTAFMSMVVEGGWMADPSGINPVSAAPEMIKQANLKSYTISEYAVHKISGDVYVSTFVMQCDGTMGDQPYPAGPWYCSTVWARQGKDWKAAYHQETLGMEPPTAKSSDSEQ